MPISLTEQRRRYKGEQACKYGDRRYFRFLTRSIFKDKLPKYCEECRSTENLHIHHIRYKYPILEEDLKRLCGKCHTLEHQRLYTPPASFPMELK